MARYARIQDGALFEVSPDVEQSLEEWRALFHPSNVWVSHDGAARQGDLYDQQSGTFSSPPPPPIEEVRAAARRAIDDAAGAARDRFITTAPGQESVYQLKREAARDYQEAGYTGDVPSIIQAEANAQGMTPTQATDFILATAAQWIAIAVQIEQNRIAGKVAVQAAQSVSAVETIRDDALAALEAIKPG